MKLRSRKILMHGFNVNSKLSMPDDIMVEVYLSWFSVMMFIVSLFLFQSSACIDIHIFEGSANDLCMQVYLKNLPPNSTLINEIMDHVKAFLVSKALLKGDPSTTSHSLRHLRGESVSFSPFNNFCYPFHLLEKIKSSSRIWIFVLLKWYSYDS